ncbi:MAG: hypothetical protein IJT79_07950 [Ruminococcus sp.]|nr:hypothetical protein [Ruminococcus sp.]
MSLQKRKIAYHNIVFKNDENNYFDNKLFFKFVDYLDSLNSDEKTFRDDKNKKAVSIESIEQIKKEGMDFLKIVFKSCKYNHFPDYMSSVDGSERPTDKKEYEGDKELTHMMMRVDASEAYTIFEERRNGVTIGGVIKYFNKVLADYFRINKIDNKSYFWAGNIPPEDFLTSLNKAKRINIADIFLHESILGSEGLNLITDGGFDCREELVLTMKSKKGESIRKTAIKTLYSRISSSGTKLERIRLYGRDIDNMDVTLDSLQQKKKQEIIVELRENGTVDTYSIFAKMEELFGITE